MVLQTNSAPSVISGTSKTSRKSLSHKTQKLLKAAALISDTLKALETGLGPNGASPPNNLQDPSKDNPSGTSLPNVIQNDNVASIDSAAPTDDVVYYPSGDASNQLPEHGEERSKKAPTMANPQYHSHPLYVNGQNLESIFEMDHPSNPIFTPFRKPQPDAMKNATIVTNIREQKVMTSQHTASLSTQDKRRLEHLEYENGLLRSQLKNNTEVTQMQPPATSGNVPVSTVSQSTTDGSYSQAIAQNQILNAKIASLSNETKSLFEQNQQLRQENEMLRMEQQQLIQQQSQPQPPRHELNSVVNTELLQTVERHIQWVMDRRAAVQSIENSNLATSHSFAKHTDSILALFQTLHRLTSSSGSLDPVQFINMCAEFSELLAMSVSEICGNYEDLIDLERHVEKLRIESSRVRKEAESAVHAVADRYEGKMKKMRQSHEEMALLYENAQKAVRETEKMNRSLKDQLAQANEDMKDLRAALTAKPDHVPYRPTDPYIHAAQPPAPPVHVVSLDQILDPSVINKEELEVLHLEMNRVREEKIHLEKHVLSLESTIEKWKKQNSELQEKLSEQKHAMSNLNQTLANQKKQLLKAESKIEDKRLELKKALENIKNLKEGYQPSEESTSLKSFEQLVALLQSQLQQHVQQDDGGNSRTPDHITLESYISLVKENEEASAQLKSFAATMEDVTTRLKELSQENESLNSCLTSTKEKMKAREAVWIEKIKDIQDSYNRLMEEHETLNMVLIEYQTQYHDILAFLQNGPHHKDSISANAHPYPFTELFAKMKASLGVTEQEISKLQSRLSEVHEQLQEKNEQLEAQTLASTAMSEELSSHKERMHSLECQLQKNTLHLSQVEQKLDEAQTAKGSLEKKLKKVAEGYKLMIGISSTSPSSIIKM